MITNCYHNFRHNFRQRLF